MISKYKVQEVLKVEAYFVLLYERKKRQQRQYMRFIIFLNKSF